MMPRGPCRIKLKGDTKAAEKRIGRAQSQLDILERHMSFQNLRQGSRRVKLEDGTEVECNICFGQKQIQIYVPPITEEEEEKEILEGACPIQLLTDIIDFTGGYAQINSAAFCVNVLGNCEFMLTKAARLLKNQRLNNLTQCKYSYDDGVGKIIVSLYHYDSCTSPSSPSRVVRLVSHKGSKDFEFIMQYGGGISVDLIASLSENLKRLYISINYQSGYVPLDKRYLNFYIYDLRAYEDNTKEWVFTEGGTTPTGMSYIDNVITRDGKIGCWQGDGEIIDEGDGILYENDCPGGSSYHFGNRTEPIYHTYNIESKGFEETKRLEGYHLSPFTQDYATCRRIEDYDYGPTGTVIRNDCACVCDIYTIRCWEGSPPSWVTHGPYIGSSSHHYCSETYSGNCWSGEYELFGWEKIVSVDWGEFYSGVIHRYDRNYTLTQDRRTCNFTITDGNTLVVSTTNNFNGQGTLSLHSQLTALVFTNKNSLERTIEKVGNCGFDGSGGGWVAGGDCNTSGSYYCRGEGSYECSEDKNEDTGWVQKKDGEILSPIALPDVDSRNVNNVFITCNHETNSMFRGVQYKVGDEYVWKVLAKVGDCAEVDISAFLEQNLSVDHYRNMEAIIFV